jgi:hypothetical protein
MKKFVFLAAAFGLFFAAPIVGAQESRAGKLQISAGGSYSLLMAGEQKAVGDAMLIPKPELYSGLRWFAHAVFFPTSFFGVNATILFAGLIQAHSSKISESLDIYTSNAVHAGLVVRYALSPLLTIHAGAGGTYTFLKLARQFEQLVYPFVFYDIDPGIGWYAKVGMNYRLSRSMFFGLAVQYLYQNAMFASGVSLDGAYVVVPFFFGLYF